MKSPKGFGKRYFTFASILAHTVQIKLENQIIIVKKTLQIRTSKEEEESIEEDPPELLLCSPFIQNFNKPCHCDCFYKKKTKLAISLFKFIPRCPYYTTYFAFRRTGVHPPFLYIL